MSDASYYSHERKTQEKHKKNKQTHNCQKLDFFVTAFENNDEMLKDLHIIIKYNKYTNTLIKPQKPRNFKHVSYGTGCHLMIPRCFALSRPPVGVTEQPDTAV